MQCPFIHPYAYSILILLFTTITATTEFILLLLLFYYCHCYKIVATDKLLRASLFLGAADLTNQPSKLIFILWIPLCRINKFGLYYPRRLLRSPILVGHQDYFLAPLPGSIALFISQLGSDSVLCNSFIMGKARDKVTIFPSTTRRGTTLSTSAALDSPSVMSKLLSPPHPNATVSSAESGNSSDNCDDASTVLDKSGSLGPFLESEIARAKRIEEADNTTPVSSREPSESPFDDLDEAYINISVLDGDLIEECQTKDISTVKKLLANKAVRYKLSPDAKFATSPINISYTDYDFSLDLSYISIVEKNPFYGIENEDAMKHMNELAALSNVFSDDTKMRTFFITKNFLLL